MARIGLDVTRTHRYVTHNSEESYRLGSQLGQRLPPGSVVCFFGDLGAGKTTMIKGLVEGAGVPSECRVTSPTYTYLNIYQGPIPVYHFDLYRLSGADEFLAMGFDEYFDAGGICCVEWSEKIDPVIDVSVIRVEIEHLSGDERKITINNLAPDEAPLL